MKASTKTEPIQRSIPPAMEGTYYLITKKAHPWEGHTGKPLYFEPLPGGWVLVLELDNGQKTCVSGMGELQRVERGE